MSDKQEFTQEQITLAFCEIADKARMARYQCIEATQD